MVKVPIHETKTQLSSLLQRVAAGKRSTLLTAAFPWLAWLPWSTRTRGDSSGSNATASGFQTISTRPCAETAEGVSILIGGRAFAVLGDMPGILEWVRKTKNPIRITRFGWPVADVYPSTPPAEEFDCAGSMAGTIELVADVVARGSRKMVRRSVEAVARHAIWLWSLERSHR